MFVGFQNQSPLLVRPCLYRCCKRDLGVCNGKNMQSWIAMFLVLPPTNQTWHATNTVVASCVNTDFWLDNIKRESRNTRELRHLLQILLNIVELLSPYCNKSSQVATTWIVARKVWTWLVKCATSLLNSFCSNAAKTSKLRGFFACFTVPLKQEERSPTTGGR